MPETETPSVLPSLLYVPCAEHVALPADARPLMRKTDDGRLMMIVYSSLDLLYAGWGDNHPWLALLTENLDSLQESQGFDLIALDFDMA